MFKIIKNSLSLLEKSLLTFFYKLKPKYFFYQSFNLFQNYPAKPKIIGLELTKNTRLGKKGDVLYLPNDAYLAWWLMKYGEIKYPISDFVENKLQDNNRYTFIDIGANVGFTSREVFLNNTNIDQIICIEPVKSTFSCLEKNTSTFQKRLLFNFALGQNNSTEEIYIDNANNGNASLVESMMNTSKYKSYETEKIEIKSVDDFFKNIADEVNNQGLIIKIDTQLYDELIFSLLPEDIIKQTHMVCYELTFLKGIQGPEFSIEKFENNISSFNTIWSKELGTISKEELIKITAREKNIGNLETDIYLLK